MIATSNSPFYFTTSWDDGAADDLRLAELLAKYHLPATFYVAQKHENGHLSEREIKQLGHHFELGAHTLSHRILSACTDEEAVSEIAGSKVWIEMLSGKPCRVFCFPCGKFRYSQLELLRQAGFVGTRTVELISTALPRLYGGIVVMPTTIQAFPHRHLTYLKNIIVRLSIGNLQNYFAFARDKDWESSAVRLLSHVSQAGGVFHLWGHSWEIEQQNGWMQVEEILHLLSEYRACGQYLTNGDLCNLIMNKSYSTAGF